MSVTYIFPYPSNETPYGLEIKVGVDPEYNVAPVMIVTFEVHTAVGHNVAVRAIKENTKFFEIK